MGLWNHAAKTAVGVLVPATLGVLAVYFNMTPSATAAWLKHEVTLPRWEFWLLVIVAFLPIAAILAVVFFRALASPEEAYQVDVFLGFKWRWDFGTDGQLEHLQRYCRICDSDRYKQKELPDSLAVVITCENCNLATTVPDPHLLSSRVQSEVERRIRTGEWRGAGRRIRAARNIKADPRPGKMRQTVP